MPRFIARIFRTVPIKVVDLNGALGLDEESPAAATEAVLKDKFGPLALRFKIFFSDVSYQKTAPARLAQAGIEIMSFDSKFDGYPQSGIVHCDPLVQDDIHRADGALWSELSRIGIYTSVDD